LGRARERLSILKTCLVLGGKMRNKKGVVEPILLLALAVIVLAIIGFGAYLHYSERIDFFRFLPGFNVSQPAQEGVEIIGYNIKAGTVEYYDGTTWREVPAEGVTIGEKRLDKGGLLSDFAGGYWYSVSARGNHHRTLDSGGFKADVRLGIINQNFEVKELVFFDLFTRDVAGYNKGDVIADLKFDGGSVDVGDKYFSLSTNVEGVVHYRYKDRWEGSLDKINWKDLLSLEEDLGVFSSGTKVLFSKLIPLNFEEGRDVLLNKKEHTYLDPVDGWSTFTAYTLNLVGVRTGGEVFSFIFVDGAWRWYLGSAIETIGPDDFSDTGMVSVTEQQGGDVIIKMDGVGSLDEGLDVLYTSGLSFDESKVPFVAGRYSVALDGSLKLQPLGSGGLGTQEIRDDLREYEKELVKEVVAWRDSIKEKPINIRYLNANTRVPIKDKWFCVEFISEGLVVRLDKPAVDGEDTKCPA
jgi:hypothetical protein